MLVRLLLGLGLVVMLSACEQQKSQEIQWQLPLSVPDDPHAANDGNTLPDWATQLTGTAKIIFLQKSTARLSSVILENGKSSEMGNWHIELLGLAQGLRVKDHAFIHDEQVANPAAYVRLTLSGKVMYEGWLYQNFPELFGMDNSDWKVWVEDVTMPPPSQNDT